jgi:leucyl-tRNA synthetase
LFTDSEEKRPLGSAETLKVLRRKVHQTLRRVTRNFEQFEFNTIISSLMELLNEMYKAREAGAVGSDEWKEAQEIYLKMMAPVTPHIAEELWYRMGKGEPSSESTAPQLTTTARPYQSIHLQSWPQVDEAAAKEDVIELPVQINGKVRDRVEVAKGAADADVLAAAKALPGVAKYLEGMTLVKEVVVPGRLVSLVVK